MKKVLHQLKNQRPTNQYLRTVIVLFFFFTFSISYEGIAQERQVGSKTRQKMEAEQKENLNAIRDSLARAEGPEFKFADKAEKDIGTGRYDRFVSFDFGEVVEGQIVEHDFNFTNVGNEALIIENALASCGCTVPEYSKEAIAPGASGKIKVSFNTTGRTGLQSKSITVNSNARVPQKVLMIKALVKERAEADSE